jgi:glycosyltransferase involved in cell wall biosynthesis
VLTNIPTPYRISFFEEVGGLLKELGGGATVLACSWSEPGRYWSPPDPSDQFSLVVMPGLHPHIADATLHWNPTVSWAIRESQPRWLLVAGAWLTPTMLQAVMTRSRSVPTIFWNEGHGQAVRHPRGIIRQLRSRALGMYDGFAVPNARSERFVREQAGDSKVVIELPNCVSEDGFSAPRGERSQYRAALGLPDQRTVLIPAALEPRKGTLAVLQAWELLDRSITTRMNLVFLGTGSLRSVVDSYSRSHESIVCAGHRAPDEVADFYRAADGVLLASTYDPNPLSLIEAARSGCTLMATKAVGNSSELIDSRNGYLIDSSQPTQIAHALRWFANLPANQLSAHQVNSLGVGAEYGCKTVASRFVEELRSCFG